MKPIKHYDEMRSRQTGKTKIIICAKLGIDMETLDAYIDTINNNKERYGYGGKDSR